MAGQRGTNINERHTVRPAIAGSETTCGEERRP